MPMGVGVNLAEGLGETLLQTFNTPLQPKNHLLLCLNTFGSLYQHQATLPKLAKGVCYYNI